jgi:glutamate-1-semialdehyde aminotransferase
VAGRTRWIETAYQQLAGIKPDLTALAKIIGGGFPVGAVGGRAEVMEVFRPGTERGISHSGTFNGNPVTAAAGLRVLELLDDEAYARLDRLGAQLADGLRIAIADAGLAAQVTHSSAVEQLFRSLPPSAQCYPEWRPDTNGHTYQLFDSGVSRLGSSLQPVFRPGRP